MAARLGDYSRSLHGEDRGGEEGAPHPGEQCLIQPTLLHPAPGKPREQYAAARVMLPGYHPYQVSHENNLPLCLARWHRHLKEQAVQRAAAMAVDQAQAELDAGHALTLTMP